MNSNALLMVFIKNLEKGRVKTRLAQSVGDKKALEIYTKLTNITRTVASEVGEADHQVWYSRYLTENDGWDNDVFDKKLQKGDDLGQRMKNAFSEAFASGYSKVVIIGSDCAQITSEIIEQAFVLLENHDLVIGPSGDGGYYLLGMSEFCERIFENISWSTPEVLPKTLQIARQKGLHVQLLTELNDVDNEQDWLEVKDQVNPA